MLYQQAAQDVVFKEAYLTPEELKKKWGAENFENYYKKLREVLDETETQVLFYQDSYAWVPYHQSSNGKTRSGKEVIGGGYISVSCDKRMSGGCEGGRRDACVSVFV